MALSNEKKQAIIAEYRVHETDTCSHEVQVAMISEQIKELTGHLKLHKKDTHSRRGMYQMIGRRRRLLNYLQNTSLDRYRSLISRLGLRR